MVQRMNLDAKHSLIAAGSVLLLFGFFWLCLTLLDGVYLPTWVLRLGFIPGDHQFRMAACWLAQSQASAC